MTASKPKLVSLFANWYSGATLLTILLAGQTEIVSNGESMFFDDKDESRYDCTCKRYIDECDFYKVAAAHMRLTDSSGWDKRLFVHTPTFSRIPILRSFLGSWRYESALRERLIHMVPRFRLTRDRFMDAQLQFFANAKSLSGASIYLDGTKSIRRAQLFARDGRVEMRALHLIRDGRGFCSSYLGHTASQNPPVSDSAKAWLRYIAQVDRFASAFPSVPIMMVKYEDLCRSTEQTIRLICNFMEIPYENRRPGTMDDVHILGNRMRRDFRGTIVEDTSWKEKLNSRTQRVLTSLMKRQLARFGYL